MILLKAVKNTFPVKHVLARNGFKWNSKDRCWEALFTGREECQRFMTKFLDNRLNHKVVFKDIEVSEEDLRPGFEKDLEDLKSILFKVKGVHVVEEVKDKNRIGLRIEAVDTEVFWYDEVEVRHLQEEIDSFKDILQELKRYHREYVNTNDIRRLDEEYMLDNFWIPLYEFLIKKRKKLTKRNRLYYEQEVRKTIKHRPVKIKPVESNEISVLRSE